HGGQYHCTDHLTGQRNGHNGGIRTAVSRAGVTPCPADGGLKLSELETATDHRDVYIVIIAVISVQREVVIREVHVQAFDGLVDVGGTVNFYIGACHPVHDNPVGVSQGRIKVLTVSAMHCERVFTGFVPYFEHAEIGITASVVFNVRVYGSQVDAGVM